jgi:hypothetical protein
MPTPKTPAVTIEFNPANWVASGPYTLTYLEETGKFAIKEYKGYEFKLVLKDSGHEDFKSYECLIVGEKAPISMFSTCKFDSDKEWSAISGDISREHENRFVAAAQMICNIL